MKINIVDHSRQPLKEAKPNNETIQVGVVETYMAQLKGRGDVSRSVRRAGGALFMSGRCLFIAFNTELEGAFIAGAGTALRRRVLLKPARRGEKRETRSVVKRGVSPCLLEPRPAKEFAVDLQHHGTALAL